jgi:hypothetical protein
VNHIDVGNHAKPLNGLRLSRQIKVLDFRFHLIPKLDVAGSTPVARSLRKPLWRQRFPSLDARSFRLTFNLQDWTSLGTAITHRAALGQNHRACVASCTASYRLHDGASALAQLA